MAKAEDDHQTEIWVDVPGFEGGYEISNMGRVRSIDRIIAAMHPRGRIVEYVRKGKLINPQQDRYGYLRLSLYRDRKLYSRLVHRLVCAAFNGPPIEGRTQVAHGDGNRKNNVHGNLRWATPLENSSDMRRHGTRLFGQSHPSSKLTIADVTAIRDERKSGSTYRTIAEKYGVGISTVFSISSGKNWVEASHG